MDARELWEAWGQGGGDAPEAWAFGDDPDGLARLVLSGDKTATASALPLYEAEGEPLPRAGEYSVLLDGQGEAVCILRTTEVSVVPFSAVTALHAFREGEGDKTLEHWRTAHRRFFTRCMAGAGLCFSEDMPVVCEAFEAVYPRPESASNAVLFDMDGTIFDTERIWFECWEPVGRAHGLEGLNALLDRCVGITDEDMTSIFMDAYGADFPYERYAGEARAIFRARYGRGLPMKPGVREILGFLRDAGVPVALASSNGMDFILRELACVGLLACFQVIAAGDEATRGKPAPDIFLLAAERLRVDPARCFVIEDSFNGIRAARAAGMRPIMVPDLQKPDAEMTALAEIIAPSLNAAADYLRGALTRTSIDRKENPSCPTST